MNKYHVPEEDYTARKHWVGFDDEVVIVLKEDDSGSQALDGLANSMAGLGGIINVNGTS
jgi:hypothetical protein